MPTIRQPKPGDTAALAALFQEMQEHYAVPCPPREEILRALASLPDGTEILVAEDDGIIGFAAFATVYPGPGLRAGFFLKELFVSAGARGRGAGRALMRALAGLAVERGHRRVDWTADRHDGKLLAFYDGIGGRRQEAKLFYRLADDELAALAARED